MMRLPTTRFALPSLAALCLALCTAAAGAASSEGDVSTRVASAGTAQVPAPAVEGRVVRAGAPVAEVLVYAFEVASRKLEKVSSDGQGRFLFDQLPAGMYKLVAFKPGFVPAVELLLRRSADDGQFVEMQLREENTGDIRDGENYWSVRGRVPADVLRDMTNIQLASRVSPQGVGGRWPFQNQAGFQLKNSEAFEAEMRALSGVEGFGGNSAQSTTAQVGLRGAVGSVQLGVDGSFQQLSSVDRGYADGEVRTVSLQMAANEDQHLRLATSESQMTSVSGSGLQPVDMLRYQVDWSGRAGTEGETRVSASYVEESNYHRSGWLDPAAVPGASQTWNLSGSYHGSFGNTALDAGLTYRQRSLLGDLNSDDILDESVGLYGVAGMQIVPRVLVEYGLFSSVRDGSLSLMPHGGVVVELGNSWKGGARVAKRAEDQRDPNVYRGFDTAFFTDQKSCRRSGEACYEVFLSRSTGDDEVLTLGAVQREYAETLRVYFSPDFFDRLESLFVVEGDRLPELQFSMMRRITPKVLAKLESNYASGGGGIFYATDNAAYENQVRYLVTSIDTQFQQTSTGVFVAFHHLEQSLNPLSGEQAADESMRAVEVQSLQLMLTQDLSALVDLASRWAVRLNMEVSRGATPYTLTHDDEMYKKLSGGFSVSF